MLSDERDMRGEPIRYIRERPGDEHGEERLPTSAKNSKRSRERQRVLEIREKKRKWRALFISKETKGKSNKIYHCPVHNLNYTSSPSITHYTVSPSIVTSKTQIFERADMKYYTTCGVNFPRKNVDIFF